MQETDTPFIFILLLRMAGALVTLGIAAAYMRRVVVARMATRCLAVALLGLCLIRNLVTGRMATPQQSNGLVFAMHFIPVLNLLAMFMLYDAPQKNNTPKENAQYYIQRDTSALAHWIVVLGSFLH
ncbi:hypothetical protein [Chitinophaga caseinilytica]|uniref:hypothetical protein n=1 Tax=Chitinophaga caseinilytica TaxID=2267521 RepID=UPI003C2AF4F0